MSVGRLAIFVAMWLTGIATSVDSAENQNNIMGIKIDSNQKIWYVNYELNNIVRIDYNLVMGDINNDGGINVLDVVSLVYFILNAEILELPTADLNSDGNINVLDVVRLVSIVLGNGPQESTLELCASDLNGDNLLNIMDVVMLVQIVLNSNL